MGLFDFFKDPDVEKMQRNNDVDGMIKALKHNKAVIRAEAAKALGSVTKECAIDPLIKCLSDQSKDVQLYAAEALGLLSSMPNLPLQATIKISSAMSQVNHLLVEFYETQKNNKVKPAVSRKLEEMIKVAVQKRQETERRLAEERREEEQRIDRERKQREVLADPHLRRGIAYADSGQYEEAIKCYNRALEINPNDSSVRNLLGVACEHVKQAEEGKEFLKRTLGGRKPSIY